MQNGKQTLAETIAGDIPQDTVVGLGSGQTLGRVIEALGQQVANGLRIVGVPTSYQTREAAKRAGIPLCEPMDIEAVDLALDGADEVDGQGRMIKGAGGALVTEKLIGAMARRCVILVEEAKLVTQLGSQPVPMEVVPPAIGFVLRALDRLGAQARWRECAGKVGPVISDLGHPLIDASFGQIDHPEELDKELNSLPGVVGHGLFLNMVNELLVARRREETITVERLHFRH